jgi:hypothetical protein
MLTFFIFLVSVTIFSQPVEARERTCGPNSFPYGATIGLVAPKNNLKAMTDRSLEAQAAIVQDNGSTKALGWIAWDDQGWPWVGLNPSSPPEIVVLFPGATHSNAATVKNAVLHGSRFGAVRAGVLRLPVGYRLLYCSAAT